MSPNKGKQPSVGAKQQQRTAFARADSKVPLAAVMIQVKVSPEQFLLAKLRGSLCLFSFTDTQHSMGNTDQNRGQEDLELDELRIPTKCCREGKKASHGRYLLG